MFGLQDWCFDHLPKFSMGKLRYSTILIRIFPPEEVRFVTCSPKPEGVAKVFDLAGRIDQQIESTGELLAEI